MKHQAGEKFSITGVDLNIEINGCFPGGQGRAMHITENSYQITVNGVPMDITERHLDLLQSSVIKEAETGVIEIPKSALEDMVQIPLAPPDEIRTTKKLGRPKKTK